MTNGKEDACRKKNKDRAGNQIKTNSRVETADKLFGIKKYKEKYCGQKNDKESDGMVRVLDQKFRPSTKVVFKRRNLVISGEELDAREEQEK